MTGTEIVRQSGNSLQDKLTYAKALADSGLLPGAYRKQPANVLYATEFGEMLGLAPLAAINGLHIIEGKPTASAGMVSSLVRKAGHRLRSGFDKAAGIGWCEIVRHDDPEFTYRSEWTVKRAIDAGLVEMKNGRLFARDSKGKPKPWERYPEAMCKARAVTECARDACEEALNGVHYTPEELGADVDETGEPIKATAERADQPPAVAEPADRAEAEPVDWQALLEQAAGDAVALRELWTRAAREEPDNSKLLLQIGEAGKAAAAAAEGIVDAEIVDEHGPEGTPEAEPAPAEQTPTEAPTPAKQADPPTERQLTKLHTQLTRLAVIGTEKYSTVSLLAGREVKSTKELTRPEIAGVIDLLERCLEDPQPAHALDAVLAELVNTTPTPKEA